MIALDLIILSGVASVCAAFFQLGRLFERGRAGRRGITS